MYKRPSAGVKIGGLAVNLMRLPGSGGGMRFRDWLRKRRDAASQGEGDWPSESSEKNGIEEEVDPFNPFPEPVTIEITDVFDLHTISPREVKRVVEVYLAEAYRAGYGSVRIIHGKGKGVQRQMVRTILARTPFVIDWTDAPPEAGGLGATIIRLTREGG